MKPIELGASIFVRVNKNLWRASDEFNLTRLNFEEEDSTMGIWDGQNFLLTVSLPLTLLIRPNYVFSSDRKRRLSQQLVEHAQNHLEIWLCCPYSDKEDVRNEGLASMSFENLWGFSVNTVLNQFVQLYSPEAPKWDNISSLASSFEWTDMHTQTTLGYLDNLEVSQKFTREFVEAATRVNYGQDVDNIHALEGLCSMAAEGAVGIQGGNFQIFEQFLFRSKANLYLSTAVRTYPLHCDVI